MRFKQPGTFKCARARCKTCPFICNVEKLSGPKRYLSQCHLLYKMHSLQRVILYIGETGRRLGDRFREHLRDLEKDEKNACKPVARHFNLPNHSMQHMAVCGLSLHQGNTESPQTLEKIFFFKSALLIFTVSTNAFHSTNLFCCFSRYQAPTNSGAPYFCI